jgi:hypothetical protein
MEEDKNFSLNSILDPITIKTYEICFDCGFPEDNHNFRHIYKPTTLNYCNSLIILNEENLKFQNKTVCSIEQCNMNKYLHGGLSNHSFVPKEIKTLNIKYSIPENMKCKICNNFLLEHEEFDDKHCFEINVQIDKVKGSADEIEFFNQKNRKKIKINIFEKNGKKL